MAQKNIEALSCSTIDLFKTLPSFTETAFVAEQITAIPADSFTLVYNEFHGVGKSVIGEISLPGPSVIADDPRWLEFEFDDQDPEDTLASLYQYYISAMLWSTMFENNTAEEGQRMISMDGATKNGEEMVKTLSILYNKTRQARITTELSEIVGGMAGMETV